MIYPKFKEALCQQTILLSQGLIAFMVDGDRYQFDAAHENVGDMPRDAVIGQPVRLDGVDWTNAILTAAPIQFDAVQGVVPDSIMICAADGGKLVVLLDKLKWSEMPTDGKPVQVIWPEEGICQL